MTLTLIISAITVLLMSLSVLIKPYIKISKFTVGLYWIICMIGAISILACGCISIKDTFIGITAHNSVNPIKILTLFLSMTLISVLLGDAGFFDYIANSVFVKSKGGQLRLFIAFYLVVSVLTIFTSNDIIILTFTPTICLFCKKAGILPLPFLIGEFVAANTWSMMLIVGNPTNIYLAQSAGIGFAEYFSVMLLPTIIGGLTAFGVVILLFYKQLNTPLNKAPTLLDGEKVKVQKIPMIVAIAHLCLCIILLTVCDFIGVEMWIICLTLALSLVVFDLIYDKIKLHSITPVCRSIKKEPYELVPFVLSMFIIVLALKESGVTAILNRLLISGKNYDGFTVGLWSALCSNLLNNIPMSVFFESIISGQNTLSVYATIIGSNIGAFITPIGALAGIMWNKLLRDYNVKLPFIKFIAYGTAVAIPTLVTSLVTLTLVI